MNKTKDYIATPDLHEQAGLWRMNYPVGEWVGTEEQWIKFRELEKEYQTKNEKN